MDYDSILLAGLNHRTATIDIRERFTLNSCGLDVVHGELRRLAAKSPALQEVVVISTCNRLEVYCGRQRSRGGHRRRSANTWPTCMAPAPTDLGGLLYHAHDEEAVRHLMRVTSGLDSLILGEPQILGQVADAFEAAKAAGSHGPVLSHLFSHALHCGKRARTETAIGSHTISISHAAALLAEQKLGPLARRAGAGDRGGRDGRAGRHGPPAAWRWRRSPASTARRSAPSGSPRGWAGRRWRGRSWTRRCWRPTW